MIHKKEMMRTIKYSLFNRLSAQAEEADVQGLGKIAEALTNQITKYSSSGLVRENTSFYSYQEEDFKKDIANHLWDAVIRTADYFNISKMDASNIQVMIEKISQEMITELCVGAGIKHGVGAYDNKVPGEETRDVEIEIGEEDI